MGEKRDRENLYCKKCGKKTLHKKCGFGTPGSMCGNARYECLTCHTERF